MNHLFISGSPNTGKTETIYDLTAYLLTNNRYIIKKGITSKGDKLSSDFFEIPNVDKSKSIDFLCILEKKDKTVSILINSDSDEINGIDNFIYFYEENPSVDTVITSIRGYLDPMRILLLDKFDTLLDELGIDSNITEIPLAKITKRGDNLIAAVNWYRNNIIELIKLVLKNSPFSLLT